MSETHFGEIGPLDACGVCVNPRTRRACGRPAIAEIDTVFGPVPLCQKHSDERAPMADQSGSYSPPSS